MIAKRIILACSIVSLSACTITGKRYDKADSTPLKIRMNTAKVLAPSFDSGEIQNGGYLDEGQLQQLITQVAAENNNQDKKRALGILLLNESDSSCFTYLTTITTVERTTRSILGVSSELLSAAAALATPVESANILSGISGATQGLEGELSNSVLGGEDGEILVQAVRKGRGRQRKIMTDLLKDDAGFQSNFGHFLIEFPTYHTSCGINYGRQVLRGAVTFDNALNQSPNYEVNKP